MLFIYITTILKNFNVKSIISSPWVPIRQKVNMDGGPPPNKKIKIDPNLKKCCVPYCPTRALSGFSRIPTNEAKKQEWLKLLEIQDETILTPNSRVCHEHFLESDFINSENRKRLKTNVVPSINLPLVIPLVYYDGDLGLTQDDNDTNDNTSPVPLENVEIPSTSTQPTVIWVVEFSSRGYNIRKSVA